jgi:hypothetical protein
MRLCPGSRWGEEPVRVEDIAVVAPNPSVSHHEAVNVVCKYVLWKNLTVHTLCSVGECTLRECNSPHIRLTLSPRVGLLDTSGNRN